MDKPRVFIGSSRESIDLVNAVHELLHYHAEVTPWPTAFAANHYPMEDLEKQVEANDFAVFVFSPDDVVTIREKVYLTPRDNTMFELGMFWGRLKRSRVFFIVPAATEPERNGLRIDDFHIPSDLSGLTLLKYEIRSDRNYRAAVNVACAHIIGRIQELGPFTDTVAMLQYTEQQLQRKQQVLEFIHAMLDVNHAAGPVYEKLYEAFRFCYNISSLRGSRLRGASIWVPEGTEGIRQVAGNVGKGRFYPFSANEGRRVDEQRIGVLDAFLNNKVQFLLYKEHIAYEYLLCYSVGKKLVMTVHLTVPYLVSTNDLARIEEENQELLDAVHYLFGGDSNE